MSRMPSHAQISIDKKQLSFVHFWAVYLVFYSVFYFFKCFNEVMDVVREHIEIRSYFISKKTFSSANELDDFDDTGYEIMFSLTEKLALTLKLIVYLVVIFHAKIHFKRKFCPVL